jgi:protein TonB
MQSKKNKKADLESKPPLFFEIGMATAILFALLAFEWTTTNTILIDLAKAPSTIIEQRLIPITKHEEIRKPEPPKQVKFSDEIKVVDNNIEIEDSPEIFDSEFFEDKAVSIIKFSENETEEDEPFQKVEIMPTFMGGDVNYFRSKYVLPNIHYPEIAAANGISGNVIVEFVIERDGSVSNVKVLNRIDESLAIEAIRVVSNSPKWEPGVNNGVYVRVKFIIPIKFVLN